MSDSFPVHQRDDCFYSIFPAVFITKLDPQVPLTTVMCILIMVGCMLMTRQTTLQVGKWCFSVKVIDPEHCKMGVW